MRYFSKFLLLAVISFVTNSCTMQKPHECCGNIPDSSEIDEPLFSEHTGKDPKNWEFFTNEKGHFTPDRTQIVDKIGNNLFVRGSIPLVDKKFAYKELTETVDKDLYAKYKEHLSTNYLLIDISLLPAGQLSVEHNWFKNNPHAGCYWNRMVIGSLLNPDKVDPDKFIGLESMNLFNKFIEQIHSLVSMKCNRQVVVYVHCHVGRDRTGEIVACYRMRYLGFSYDEAIEANNKLVGPIYEINHNAIRWYAHFLRDKMGIETIGKVDGK